MYDEKINIPFYAKKNVRLNGHFNKGSTEILER
jgi:hypothetical protein